MPAVNADCVFTEATVMPLSFATAGVGGVLTTNVVSGALGTVFFNMESLTLGFGALTQYVKIFGYNANGSLQPIYNSLFWMRNSLDALPAPSQLVFFSNSANDNNTRKVRVMGYDNTGAAVQEEVTLNGLTPVSTSTVWSAIHRIEVRLVSSGALVNTLGELSVQSTSGPTIIGYVPVGKKSATSEMDIGVENVQNGGQTIAFANVAPTGVSFFRPRTSATGLAAIGGTVNAGSGQGIFGRWILPELAKPSLQCQQVLVYTGSAA